MSVWLTMLFQSWKPLYSSTSHSVNCGDTGLTSQGSHQKQRQAQYAAFTTLGTQELGYIATVGLAQ